MADGAGPPAVGENGRIPFAKVVIKLAGLPERRPATDQPTVEAFARRLARLSADDPRRDGRGGTEVFDFHLAGVPPRTDRYSGYPRSSVSVDTTARRHQVDQFGLRFNPVPLAVDPLDVGETLAEVAVEHETPRGTECQVHYYWVEGEAGRWWPQLYRSAAGFGAAEFLAWVAAVAPDVNEALADTVRCVDEERR